MFFLQKKRFQVFFSAKKRFLSVFFVFLLLCFCGFCFFLIYMVSLLMEALVTDVEVAVDFILPAIHKAVEQEVRH